MSSDHRIPPTTPPPGAAPQHSVDTPKAFVSDTQRNGSIAGIAVVLGFSLTFTATWTEGSDPWTYSSLAIMLVVAIGIAHLLAALFKVFSLPVISVESHERTRILFFRGVIGVLGGYALHIAMKAIEDIVLSDK